MTLHTLSKANGKATFALSGWTIQARANGYYIAKTVSTYHGENHQWRGPYSSLPSASLMIARDLAREFQERDERAAKHYARHDALAQHAP